MKKLRLFRIEIFLEKELLNIVKLENDCRIERKRVDEYLEEIIKNKLKYIEFAQ